MPNNNNIQQEGMLPVGTVLRGTYCIEGYLSSGGFGNTYVVTNIEFNERYAVKEFFMRGVNQRDDGKYTVSVSNSANRNSFEEQREKFKKEARRLRQLSNSHIVRVHDLFDENGTSYYVMDFIDGESLSDRLKRSGQPIPESEVRSYLLQTLDGLEEIHNKGFQHLDLKPANIMVDKQGNITIIDFGASKQMRPDGGATASTAICYTPGYAPREQMEQNFEKFGPWTDLYALGATLYNILTNNKPPMPSDIDDEGEAAFSFPASISDEMRSFIIRLMQPNRIKRPQKVIKPTWRADEETKVTKKETQPSDPREESNDETIVSKPVVKPEPKPTPTPAPKPEPLKPMVTSNNDDDNNGAKPIEKTIDNKRVINYLPSPIKKMWVTIVAIITSICILFLLLPPIFEIFSPYWAGMSYEDLQLGNVCLRDILPLKNVAYYVYLIGIAGMLLFLFVSIRKIAKIPSYLLLLSLFVLLTQPFNIIVHDLFIIYTLLLIFGISIAYQYKGNLKKMGNIIVLYSILVLLVNLMEVNGIIFYSSEENSYQSFFAWFIDFLFVYIVWWMLTRKKDANEK